MTEPGIAFCAGSSLILSTKPPEIILTVMQGTGPLITFYYDGRIEVAPDARPSETARAILEKMAEAFPQWIRKPNESACAHDWRAGQHGRYCCKCNADEPSAG